MVSACSHEDEIRIGGVKRLCFVIQKYPGKVGVKRQSILGSFRLGEADLALRPTPLNLDGEAFKVNVTPLQAQQFGNPQT